MTSYTDADLEAMLNDLEPDLVEPTRTGADRSSIRRNTCAFANDLAGHGHPCAIFVGVENDGTCANIAIDDRDLDCSQARLLPEGKKGGEFCTPSHVVRVRVDVLALFKGRVYDPCCGSGGTFHDDRHPDLKADCVPVNPPFNDSDWHGELLKDNKRRVFGVQPAGNANYSGLQRQ